MRRLGATSRDTRLQLQKIQQEQQEQDRANVYPINVLAEYRDIRERCVMAEPMGPRGHRDPRESKTGIRELQGSVISSSNDDQLSITAVQKPGEKTKRTSTDLKQGRSQPTPESRRLSVEHFGVKHSKPFLPALHSLDNSSASLYSAQLQPLAAAPAPRAGTFIYMLQHPSLVQRHSAASRTISGVRDSLLVPTPSAVVRPRGPVASNDGTTGTTKLFRGRTLIAKETAERSPLHRASILKGFSVSPAV